MKRILAWSSTIALAILLGVGVVAWRGPDLPPILATDQLPAGSTLIYASMGGDPAVRVIRVEECYIVQALKYRTWLVLDRGGWFATQASIDCGPDATWSAP